MESCSMPTTHSQILAATVAFLLALGPSISVGAEPASPAPPEGKKYALRYQFQPGEIVRMQVLHRVNLDTTISGTTQTAETTSGSVKVWKIIDVDAAGHITLEHSVESVDMRQKLSGRDEVTYNSQTDKQPPPGYE